MELLTLITTYFPELKFISQTDSTNHTNSIISDGSMYLHELKLMYLPESEKYGSITLLYLRHIDSKSYIDKELIEQFEKDLLIQLAFSAETNGKIVDNNGVRIYTWADIRKQLKPNKNLC